MPPNPMPVVSGVSPSTATVGAAALTVTVTGSGFIASSSVEWNGGSLSTTYESATSLKAQVPASDLAAAATANITVVNPAPGGGSSANASFTVSSPSTYLTVLDIAGSDLTWDPSQKKIYVAVPSGATTNPGTITVVDPVAGTIGNTQTPSSAPTGLAISDDSAYLYAVIDGGATIQRFALPGLTPDIQWTLGTDPSSSSANLAGDIKVEPGASHTLAVSYGQYGSGSVAVFDDGVARPSVASNGIGNALEWNKDGNALYAIITLIQDSPYYTTGDVGLSSMPVTSAGVGSVTSYSSVFREEGARFHNDPTTGYLYDDWGEVVNSANGVPIGNTRWARPGGTSFPGPVSALDPTLGYFYTLLEVMEPDNSMAFQVQVFDQKQFQLLGTIVIPNAVGMPTNLIRWGQAGLAVVTDGGGSAAPGKLYLLDGGFVNPTGAPDTSAGTEIVQVPTLTGISPLTATVGGQGLTLTVNGHGFSGQPTVYWNGSSLQTSLVNGTQVTAMVPSSNLSTAGEATVTASNSGSPLPISNALTFAVDPAPATGNTIAVYDAGGDDLVWNASAAKIYVSEPGVQGDTGDAIGFVDPAAATVASSGFLGSDPDKISLSSDGNYLYMALDGANSIQQLTLPNFTANASWNLGGETSFGGPYYALDLQSAPGAPQTTAVTLGNFDFSPASAGLVIYDGATPRPNVLPPYQYPYSSLQWGSSDATLYAVDGEEPQDFLVLGVGSSGAVLDHAYASLLSPYSESIHLDAGTGFVYTDGGEVVQPSTGTVVGNYGASGIAVPDSSIDRVFILGQTSAQSGTSNYTVEVFDQTKLTAVGSITIDNVVGTPTAMIRWGTNGLAFTTLVGRPTWFNANGPGLLYVISGTIVAASQEKGSSGSVKPLDSVHRTWDAEVGRRQQRGASVLHVSPLAH
ncbi:MAG: hypothetical protein ABR923_01530 [Terracidiphilus sp.]